MLAATAWAASLAAAAQETLTYPPVLENLSSAPHTVEVSLTAAPAVLGLVPGAVTHVYAYNGRIPGPTLEAREGDRVIVHFTNFLPEPSTIHWHGIHLPASMDGSPLDPVAPGGRYDYVFTIPMGTAGTYWYHPHPHHRTGFQVAMGLYGAIIVRPAPDPLPASLPEKLLILTDSRFGVGGAIEIDPGHHAPPNPIDEATGGRAAYLRLTSSVTSIRVTAWAERTSSGKRERIDMGKHMVEIYAKAPNRRLSVIKTPGEKDGREGYDGKIGWIDHGGRQARSSWQAM